MFPGYKEFKTILDDARKQNVSFAKLLDNFIILHMGEIDLKNEKQIIRNINQSVAIVIFYVIKNIFLFVLKSN